MKELNVSIASSKSSNLSTDVSVSSTMSLTSICNDLDKAIVKLRAYAATKGDISQQQIDAALANYGNSKAHGKFQDFITGV